jgi:membrane-bound ClpP family serine protease
MNVVYIIFLLLLGALFLLAELLLLPGVTLGAILSLGCYGGAIYLGFALYGTTVGVVVVVVAILSALLTVILSLRGKTWQKLSLHQNIDSVSTENPENTVSVGDKGVAVSRISPMGKVEIGGKRYEAKSADVFIDQREEIEVVGFDNTSVVVRKINQ